MRSFLGTLLLAMSLPVLLPASEFDGLVNAFSRQTGSQPMRIPFFGLARFAVALMHPEGTSDLRLAVFENANVPPRDFSKVTDNVVGSSWSRLIRTRSRNGESTSIYTRQDGHHLRVLVATMDNSEATFVEMRIKPEDLMKFLDEHQTGR